MNKMTNNLIKKVISSLELDKNLLEKLNENLKIPEELWDKFYKSNEEANKLYMRLLKNLSPRIETKIAVKKIRNSKYNPQLYQNYHKINSQLNILKY